MTEVLPFVSPSPSLGDTQRPGPYSREHFLAQLGPELMADIAAQVAAAPVPSPRKVEEIRRLFAAAPVPRPSH